MCHLCIEIEMVNYVSYISSGRGTLLLMFHLIHVMSLEASVSIQILQVRLLQGSDLCKATQSREHSLYLVCLGVFSPKPRDAREGGSELPSKCSQSGQETDLPNLPFTHNT